jgi:phage tail tape-measure protein
MEDQQTLDEQELAPRIRALADRVDRLEAGMQDFIEKLNEAYAQGVLDSAKARIGHDPKVADDDV